MYIEKWVMFLIAGAFVCLLRIIWALLPPEAREANREAIAEVPWRWLIAASVGYYSSERAGATFLMAVLACWRVCWFAIRTTYVDAVYGKRAPWNADKPVERVGRWLDIPGVICISFFVLWQGQALWSFYMEAAERSIWLALVMMLFTGGMALGLVVALFEKFFALTFRLFGWPKKIQPVEEKESAA